MVIKIYSVKTEDGDFHVASEKNKSAVSVQHHHHQQQQQQQQQQHDLLSAAFS